MAGGVTNGGPNVGARRRRRRGHTPMSQINVTPFVDVMLVLLIVFMVTAPLITVAVPVDLPRSEARTVNEPVEPLVVSVKQDGTIFLQETEVERGNLVPRLRAITDRTPDTRIYVRGDESLAYGEIMEVMGIINNAGFTRVALVSNRE